MTVREPAVSGLFYPKIKEDLDKKIRGYLDAATQSLPGIEIKGLVSPHAGYEYSGQVAAFGFKEISTQDIDSIVLLGPSHHVSFRIASVFDGAGFKTPLGIIPVNQKLVRKLIAIDPLFQFVPEAHREEHSLEVQVPFIQHVFKNREVSIVPIVIGSHRFEDLNFLAQAILTSCQKEKTLIIASSDLSHFHSYDVAREMDLRAVDLIAKNDIGRIQEESAVGRIEMCGFAPILTMGVVLKQWGSETGKVVCYANSGDITGDKSRVVGYGSVVFSRPSGGTNVP